MLFSCKFCGGELEITEEMGVTTCKYCRTAQTLPRSKDDNLKNLFNRANALRRRNEFDKAEKLYEKIIESETTESEAYWGLILCKYGIEYVEDPDTQKMLPTCHRASYDSVVADEDYRAAIENADADRRALYEEQAREIDRIQKDILTLAREEEPYDVFICYKETDESGKRTHDSVIANDIYHQLTSEGFKVFYAAITLEGKLGSAYEPIIFAALNSAKVMLSIGTKPEYFNAVWVKNEWSRYLKIIKKDRSKLLIPCYKDMDAYELPDEFAHLQAQDMSKIGFINDIVRGIKKIIVKDEPKPVTVVKEVVKEVISENTNAPAGSTASLIKRAVMFLEDGDFKSADEYCERVLDIEPENARAYLGKLMAELKVKKQEELKNCSKPFDGNSNYQKALRFADEELKNELSGYVEHSIYTQAVKAMKAAKTENDYKKTANSFKSIPNYNDASSLSAQCLELAEKAKQKAEEKKHADELAKSIAEEGRRKKEEEARLERERRAEAERIAATKRARRKKIRVAVISLTVCLAIAFVIAFNTVIQPMLKTNEFIATYGQDSYDKFGLAAKGEYITYGAYEQDNDTSNGKEPIEWLVLDVQNGKALVISKYALDHTKYNQNSKANVTWETCSLRSWLNGEFLDDAFTDEEKTAIVLTTVVTDKNPDYSTAPGNATEDRVFILSVTEAQTYFHSNRARKCKNTTYAYEKMSKKYKEASWWLRTPGSDQNYASFVTDYGEVANTGTNGTCSIRPAMWIDLKA